MWSWLVETAKGWSIASCVIRLTYALIVGALIGIDRGMKRRGAGIKTHALVCLGSALVMMTSQYAYLNFPERIDITRMGGQVVSGVGFLGVGTIIVTGRNQIRGLTTAAGLWACACIGLACGIGFIDGVTICLILVLFTLKVLTKLDYVIHNHAKIYDLYLEFDTNKSVPVFIEEIRSQGLKLASFEISKNKIKGEGPTAIATIEVHDKQKRPVLMQIIRGIEGVKFVEEL